MLPTSRADAASPRPTRRAAMGFLGGLLALPAAARTPFWGDRTSVDAAIAADALAKGQWVWMPQAAPRGPLLVLVNLDTQRAFAYRNGVLIGYTTISSGRAGFDTPTGVFHTLQKDKDHRSSIYNSAPMPYTQRLTWSGVALHAGGLPGYPSSHGCVHLPSAFAERLFQVSPLGMTVVVARGDMAPQLAERPAMLSPFDATTGSTAEPAPALSATEPFRWTPERAATGPVSVIVSRADQRVIVLRNGTEIGRARFAMNADTPPWGLHVFVALATPVNGAAQPAIGWVGTAVPGRADDAGVTLSPQDQARVRLPEAFLSRVMAVVGEGTTLVVTDDAVLPSTTGRALTVVTNNSAP